MTTGGTSKKVTIAGVGIAAELALANTGTASKLTFLVAVAIAVITLVAIGAQSLLDYMKDERTAAEKGG